MSKVAVVIGKFYPLHEGHKGLIEFMLNYPVDFASKAVLVCGKSHDIIPTNVRHLATKNYVGDRGQVLHMEDDSMPDYPEDDLFFWEKWTKVIERIFSHLAPEEIYLFTSEKYGEEFARKIQEIRGVKCRHIPYNLDRTSFDVSGTEIRDDMVTHSYAVDLNIINYLSKTIYVLGAESTGKTTWSKKMNVRYYSSSVFVPEYARGYLDLKGVKLNKQKFFEIIDGQFAAEEVAKKTSLLFKIHDTNLLTTYGWAKLYYPAIAEEMKRRFDFKKMYTERNSLVLLTNDSLPFYPDAQRYGINKRETNREYWVGILNEFQIPFKFIEDVPEKVIFDEFDKNKVYCPGGEMVDTPF